MATDPTEDPPAAVLAADRRTLRLLAATVEVCERAGRIVAGATSLVRRLDPPAGPLGWALLALTLVLLAVLLLAVGEWAVDVFLPRRGR